GTFLGAVWGRLPPNRAVGFSPSLWEGDGGWVFSPNLPKLLPQTIRTMCGGIVADRLAPQTVIPLSGILTIFLAFLAWF
ncbi:MAG: hypothetical protein KA314_09925, partial [Chloroflexi bacterium]|nr:hypothetical protein [Chloroflexota bacterium]